MIRSALSPRRGSSNMKSPDVSLEDTLNYHEYIHSRMLPCCVELELPWLGRLPEDNESAIKQQEARAKGAIPGSRTAQAQTQEEYYEITPGVQGAGTASGPRPDQGAGYPGLKK